MRNCSAENKLQIKTFHISPTWGIRRIKEKKKRSSKFTAAFGVERNFGLWEVKQKLTELIETIENFGKKYCKVLCVLRVHANYVSVKRTGVEHGGF